MFKKSLAALAVLSLTAGYASAANVVLYGSVDEGLMYSHDKVKVNGASETSHSFTLDSGISTASKFGLKGSEELGNGLTVSFKLENGLNADDGSFADDDGRLFNRQASLTLSGDFGALSFGRMGGVASAAGDYDLVYAIGDSYDGGDVAFGLAASDRYDNMVTYQTPSFAGLQATFQYSFNETSTNKNRENSSGVDRYAAAALTGEFGALQTVVAYEFQNYQSFGTNAKDTDGHTVYVGANYDFEVVRVFAMGEYFKGLSDVPFASGDDAFDKHFNGVDGDGVKGYGLHLGTIAPVAGGDFTAGLYYADTTAELTTGDVDGKYYGVNFKYEYPLSKRTSVYAGTGYSKAKHENDAKTYKVDNYAGYFGLTHNF